MKVVNIVPGFGGTFYCGNCLRDSAYVKSLRAAGHEAITLPMYMPLSSTDFAHEREVPVFYGAVNVYLEQKFSLFRGSPKWLHSLLNSNFILRYAAKKSGSTRATGLEAMTISMLQGSEGRQAAELEELIHFLKHHEKPDVVHLSNALLLGLAKRIREELKIPVVCSLQDEDVWVDAMDEPYRSQVWALMGQKAADVDALIAVSNYFAGRITARMEIPGEKLFVVHLGVDPSRYAVREPNLDVPTIGYLSRLNHENGFGILIDAFILLKQTPTCSHARLKVTGGQTANDERFINVQVRKLKERGYGNDIEFVEDFRTEMLGGFFDGLTLLSVPVIDGEAFGLYQLESLASGIPLVQPNVGAFSEIIQATGGGVTYSPNTPEALAAKWAEVLSNPEGITRMSRHGRDSIDNMYSTNGLIDRMVEVYSYAIENFKA